MGSAKERFDLPPVLDTRIAVASRNDSQHLLDPLDEVRGILWGCDPLPGDLDIDGTRVRQAGPSKTWGCSGPRMRRAIQLLRSIGKSTSKHSPGFLRCIRTDFIMCRHFTVHEHFDLVEWHITFHRHGSVGDCGRLLYDIRSTAWTTPSTASIGSSRAAPVGFARSFSNGNDWPANIG